MLSAGVRLAEAEAKQLKTEVLAVHVKKYVSI